jgi:hypothetical protein
VAENTNDHGLHPKAPEGRGASPRAKLRSSHAAATRWTPQTQVMWVDADEDHLLINTEVHRQRFKNVERDPRVMLTIWDREDPYRFVEVRGEVVGKVKGREAREHIDGISHKYHGRPYGTEIRSERVILRIAPMRQVVRMPT